MGDLFVVGEAAVERRTLRRIAPHLAATMPVVIPVRGKMELTKMRTGMWTYEKLGDVDPHERHEVWELGRLRQEVPRVVTEVVTAAVAYPEYVTDDARHAAVDVARPSSVPGISEPRSSAARPSRLVAALVALASFLIGSATVWLALGRQAPDPGRVRRFEIPIKTTPSELALGQALAGPALSPDGRMLAYVEGGVLRVRDLDRTVARDLAANAEGPFWSPDSREIAYLSGRVVRRVPAVGGPPVAVAEANFEGV